MVKFSSKQMGDDILYYFTTHARNWDGYETGRWDYHTIANHGVNSEVPRQRFVWRL